MESTILGVVLDSSVLIAAERRYMTAAQAIETVQKTIPELPLSCLQSRWLRSATASTAPKHPKSAVADGPSSTI